MECPVLLNLLLGFSFKGRLGWWSWRICWWCRRLRVKMVVIADSSMCCMYVTGHFLELPVWKELPLEQMDGQHSNAPQQPVTYRTITQWVKAIIGYPAWMLSRKKFSHLTNLVLKIYDCCMGPFLCQNRHQKPKMLCLKHIRVKHGADSPRCFEFIDICFVQGPLKVVIIIVRTWKSPGIKFCLASSHQSRVSAVFIPYISDNQSLKLWLSTCKHAIFYIFAYFYISHLVLIKLLRSSLFGILRATFYSFQKMN